MPTIKGPYWLFYLMGRGRKRPPNAEIDDDIDKMVNEGGDFRDVVRKRCEAAVMEWATGRRRDTFLKDCADEIQKAGGAAAAWDAYLAGVTDEIAYGIERDAVETLESAIYDEDEEDEEEENDDDEDSDDDED